MVHHDPVLELHTGPLPHLKPVSEYSGDESDDYSPKIVVAGKTKDSAAIVTKSNYLIEAKYKLSVPEQKFLYHVISQISPNQTRLNLYRVSVAEINRITGCNYTFPEAEEFLTTLKKRNVDVFDPSTNKRIVFSWMSIVVSDRNSMTFDFAYDNAIKPYLLDLKERFTSYPIRFIHLLRRSSSIRLFELLYTLRQLPTKRRTYSYAELRHFLGIEDHEYPKYKDFRRWVIEPARKEIEHVTGMAIVYEDIRAGRSVTKLKFTVEFPSAEFNKREIWKAKLADRLAGDPFFVSPTMVRRLVEENRPEEFWRWALSRISAQLRAARPPKNPGGYTIKEIKSAWSLWLVVDAGKQPENVEATKETDAAAPLLAPQANPEAEAVWSELREQILVEVAGQQITRHIADLIATNIDGTLITLTARNPIGEFLVSEKLNLLQKSISNISSYTLKIDSALAAVSV